VPIWAGAVIAIAVAAVARAIRKILLVKFIDVLQELSALVMSIDVERGNAWVTIQTLRR
jgi:hypothetical protein